MYLVVGRTCKGKVCCPNGASTDCCVVRVDISHSSHVSIQKLARLRAGMGTVLDMALHNSQTTSHESFHHATYRTTSSRDGPSRHRYSNTFSNQPYAQLRRESKSTRFASFTGGKIPRDVQGPRSVGRRIALALQGNHRLRVTVNGKTETRNITVEFRRVPFVGALLAMPRVPGTGPSCATSNAAIRSKGFGARGRSRNAPDARSFLTATRTPYGTSNGFIVFDKSPVIASLVTASQLQRTLRGDQPIRLFRTVRGQNPDSSFFC